MRQAEYKAVMERFDGIKYVSETYTTDSGLRHLFGFENEEWDIFLEMITTEEKFVVMFPDDDEYLKGWSHIGNVQYTGLKDKNGVEIYEGDIMFDAHGEYIGQVEFSYGGFVVIYEDIIDEASEWTCCEVIGNIYENEDLFKA